MKAFEPQLRQLQRLRTQEENKQIFVRFLILTAVVMKNTPSWDITPCSSLREPSACYLLHAGFLLGLFFDLYMEATCSSEKMADFQRTKWRYIPEDKNLQTNILPVKGKT
jgi:hypothetical protein